MINTIKIIIRNLASGVQNIFLKHRNEERGIGGIFFDYLNAKSVKNFNFTVETGNFFCSFLRDMIKKTNIKFGIQNTEKNYFIREVDMLNSTFYMIKVQHLV